MNATEQKAYWIPLQYRQEIIELQEKLKRLMSLGTNDVYAVFMFNLYNAYISKNKPEDIKCSRCRSRMIHKFSQFAEIYKAYGTEYPEE
jgi:hypothetical protein